VHDRARAGQDTEAGAILDLLDDPEPQPIRSGRGAKIRTRPGNQVFSHMTWANSDSTEAFGSGSSNARQPGMRAECGA
jgi:hypothetical protein